MAGLLQMYACSYIWRGTVVNIIIINAAIGTSTAKYYAHQG